MARLEQTVYRSNCACVVDVLTFGDERIALERNSIAFVRSGYFTERYDGSAPIIDPNYVVFGGEGDCLLSGACAHISTCTVIRSTDSSPVNALQAGPALVSSPAFLMHARLLKHARSGAPGVDSNVASLFCEMRSAHHTADRHICSQLVNNIRRLLNDSLSKRLTLEALGREMYVSPFTVSRLFHRETGVRLRDYVVRLRLRRALNQLLHTRKSLTTIAVDLGFYDEPHFSNAFHFEFGVSPYSVRKY